MPSDFKCLRAIPPDLPTEPTKEANHTSERVVEALRTLVHMRKGIISEVRTAHRHRGDGASEWMREDDRDFRRDLEKAFDAAEAALKEEMT